MTSSFSGHLPAMHHATRVPRKFNESLLKQYIPKRNQAMFAPFLVKHLQTTRPNCMVGKLLARAWVPISQGGKPRKTWRTSEHAAQARQAQDS